MSGASPSSITNSLGTTNIIIDNTVIADGKENAITFNPKSKTDDSEIISNKNLYTNKAQVATNVTATYESEPNSILFQTPVKSEEKDNHINLIPMETNKTSIEPEILSNIATSIVSGLSGLGGVVANMASVITSTFFSKEQLTETYKKNFLSFISNNKDDIDFLVDSLLPNNDAKNVDDFLHKLDKPDTNIESVTPEVKKSFFKLLDDSEKLKRSLSKTLIGKSKNDPNKKEDQLKFSKIESILTNLKTNEQFKELSVDNSFDNIYKNFTSSSSDFFDNFLHFDTSDKSEKNNIDESKTSIEKLMSLAEKINLPKTQSETKEEENQSKILLESKNSVEELVSILEIKGNSDNNIEKLKSFLNGDKTVDFKDIKKGLQDVLEKANALPKDKIGNASELIKEITSKNSKLLENTNVISNNISKLRDLLSKGNISGNEEAEDSLVSLLINSEDLIKSLPKEESSKMAAVISEIKNKNDNLVEKVERRNQLKENYEKSKVSATSAVEKLKEKLDTIKDPKLQRLLSNLINAGYSDAMNNPFLSELFASGTNNVLALLSNPDGLKPSELYKKVTDYCSEFTGVVSKVSELMPKKGEPNPNPEKVASNILNFINRTKNKKILNQDFTNTPIGKTLTDRIEFMFKNPEAVSNEVASDVTAAAIGGIADGCPESNRTKGMKRLTTKEPVVTEQINNINEAAKALAMETPKEQNDSYTDFREKIVDTNILSEVLKTQENKENDFFNYFQAEVSCISARQDLTNYINDNKEVIDNILNSIDSNQQYIQQIKQEGSNKINEIRYEVIDKAIKDAENAESILNSMEFEIDNNLFNGIQLLEKFREIIVELDLGLRVINQKVNGLTKIDVDFMKEIQENKKRRDKVDKVLKMLKRDFDNSIEVKSGILSNVAKKAILRNDLKMISLVIQEMNATKQGIGFEL